MLLSDFEEPFLPLTESPQAEMAELLARYEADPRPQALRVEILEEYLEQNPDSPWAPSISLNLGLSYNLQGRPSRALESLERAWTGLKDSKDLKLKALADRALGEYASTLARYGRQDELENLLVNEAKTRSLTGAATEFVTVAAEALMEMKNSPQTAFMCGPNSVRKLSEILGHESDEVEKLVASLPSTKKGTSLAQIHALSDDIGLDYVIARREPGAEILTPAIAHLKVGHFTTLSTPKGGSYPVADDTLNFLGGRVTLEKVALEEECSGYFLVPRGELPSGWRLVPIAEAETVWGRGISGDNLDLGDTNGLLMWIVNTIRCFLGNCDGNSKGMTTWDVQSQLVSLCLQDTPVGTSPSTFAVPFTICYSQREAGQPAVFTYGNLGPKWVSNWDARVFDNRANLRADVHKIGGGYDTYFFINLTTSAPGTHTQATINWGPDGPVIDYPDGSREEYFQRIGALNYHLTARITPQGNTYRVVYDDSNRMVEIVDAVGRSMTIAYDHPTDPLKITQVTDPFGRSATFSYNDDGQLASVTDTLGLVSSYQYGANDFIETLNTPYGTTTFSTFDLDTFPAGGTLRVVEITDALGRNYRVEKAEGPSTGVPRIASSDVPAGMPVFNNFQDGRNTFIWHPNQLDSAPVYNKAVRHHFAHDARIGVSKGSRVLEAVKNPLENQVWYAHNGIASYVEFNSRITHIGRVLADGTTQLTRYTYNNLGNVLSMIDPLNRTYEYGYAPNGIDVTSVSRREGAVLTTLLTATYDNNHNITSVTDASGATSNFTYNTLGQVLTSTNPLGETTTYTYTPTGDIASIQSPLQATTTFQYDSVGRVSSATDSEGYTVRATYDSFDRPVSVLYPDGTSDSLTYSRLDLVSTTDRIGRQTLMAYDALRRPLSVTDPNGGVTSLGYGLEDKPTSLTDPNGNTTNFIYDLQQRLATKQYPDGNSMTTTYEPCCGRPSTVTDALGQTKTYTYFLDNQLKSIEYSDDTPTVNFTIDNFLRRPLTMTDFVNRKVPHFDHRKFPHP